MNCKQGDLAIIVHSVAGNEGRIVRCVRLAGSVLYGYRGVPIESAVSWEVDRELPSMDWPHKFVADKNLRPIRPDGITDEEVKELFAPSLPVKEQA